MTEPRDVRVSKFLSLVLRHEPGRIGLVLDDGGWVDVDELLTASRAHGFEIGADELALVVASSPKQRFAIDPDTNRIRANQGHSVHVELGLDPVVPPPVLYHGTSRRTMDAIMREGLRPMGRRQVHLSPDEAAASAVGRRHGPLVVLKVDAQRMHTNGHDFFMAPNGVWLTDNVPADYLSEV